MPVRTGKQYIHGLRERPPNLYMSGKKVKDATKEPGLIGGIKPLARLYDLQNDPDEVVNLAQDPAHAAQLDAMRFQLEDWIVDTDDKGQYPRSEAAWTEITERFPASWLRSPEFQ